MDILFSPHRKKKLSLVQRAALFIVTLTVFSLFLPSEFAFAQGLSGESTSFKVQGVIAVPIPMDSTVTIPLKSSAPSYSPSITTKTVSPTKSSAPSKKRPIQQKSSLAPAVLEQPTAVKETVIAYCEGVAQLPSLAQNSLFGSSIADRKLVSIHDGEAIEINYTLVYIFIAALIVLGFSFLYISSLEKKVSRLEDLILGKMKRSTK